jgi:hypothetical protein
MIPNIDPRLTQAFNQRVERYLTKILKYIAEGNEEPITEFSASYAGGTLCLAMPFWKPSPNLSADNAVTELILLNMDGQANSTIYGDFRLTSENLHRVREIYRESKGETDYYRESLRSELHPSSQGL